MPQHTKPLVTLQLLDAKFLEQGKFDARMRAKVTDTLVKLTADPTAPGLHVEPIENAADKRLRSIRVDGKYRMLAFKLAAGAGIHFVVVGVFNHDDAYARAGRMRLGINPVNGIAEILDAGSGSGYAVAESERKARAARRAAEDQAKREAEEHAAVAGPGGVGKRPRGVAKCRRGVGGPPRGVGKRPHGADARP